MGDFETIFNQLELEEENQMASNNVAGMLLNSIENRNFVSFCVFRSRTRCAVGFCISINIKSGIHSMPKWRTETGHVKKCSNNTNK